MATIKDVIKKFFTGRPDDQKFFDADGREYVDPTVIEVPLKLLQRHQDAQAYIRAYVHSEIELARINGEHESLEEAMDFDVEGDREDRLAAAELEAEELSQHAQDRYDLRRIRQMVDRDRKFKAMKKGAAAAVAAGAIPPPITEKASPVNPPVVVTPTPSS